MSKSEMFSGEEIEIIQTRQLRKTLHYLYDRSPYYRDFMDRRGLTPAYVKTLDDLRLLPLTRPGDVARENERFLCVRPEEVADVGTTSGANGTPVLFKTSEADLARLAYNEQVSFRGAGLTEKDVVALAITLDACFLRGLAYYLGLRRIGAAALRLGTPEPERCVRWLEAARVTAIVGEPYYLKEIADYARRAGVDLLRLQIRRIFCVSEPIRRRDFSYNALGGILAASWGAQLFSSYGNTEIATSFCECESGVGGHLHPELAQLDIVDEQGQVLPPGQIGEICVTPFGVTGMPVLRYCPGDLSFIRTEPCVCGRHTLRLGPILGRRGQQLVSRGQKLLPGILHDVVLSDPGVLNHLLVAEDGDQENDLLSVLIFTDDEGSAQRIQGRFRGELGLEITVRALPALELLAMQSAEDYRQRRVFLDRRSARA